MPPACLSSSWQSAQYIPAFHDCTIGRQCNQEQRYSSGTGDFWVLLQYFSLQTKSVAQIHVSTSQWTFAAWKNQGAKSGKAFKLVVCSLSHLLDCLPCFMTNKLIEPNELLLSVNPDLSILLDHWLLKFNPICSNNKNGPAGARPPLPPGRIYPVSAPETDFW